MRAIVPPRLAADAVRGQLLPHRDAIVVVTEDSSGFGEVIGQATAAPNLDGLVAQGALLTASSSLHNPSQPNDLSHEPYRDSKTCLRGAEMCDQSSYARPLATTVFFVLFCTIAASPASAQQTVPPSPCGEIFRPGGVEDPFDADYGTCPDEHGHVALRSGIERDINGIPDEELKDLFGNDGPACGDLFDEGRFGRAMHAIVQKRHLSGTGRESQRAMGAVFAAIRFSWDYFDPPLVDGYTIYGCADLNGLTAPPRTLLPPNVHLYHTMCTVNALYGANLGPMSSELRFFLVAAHEVGHVIDHMAGLRFSADREIRATVYGSAMAQCQARSIVLVLRTLRAHPLDSDATPDREAKRVQTLDCLITKYRNLDAKLAAIRWRVLATGQPATGPIATCAAPAVPNAGPAPRLEKCPEKP